MHWKILLRLLGYTILTKSYKLKLFKVNSLNISCFFRLDFASNVDMRILIGGLIFFFGEVLILWRYFQQKSFSLFSMESEYWSIYESAEEIKWIKQILDKCGSFNLFEASYSSVEIYANNLLAIYFASSPVENQWTKYIKVQLHFIRNQLKKKVYLD